MRLLIVLPNQHKATGNYVSARRIQSGLQTRGVTVELFAVDDDNADEFDSAMEQFQPDHLLLLHAWRSGRFWLNSPTQSACPATILLTGTDINQDIDDSEKGPVIQQVLQKASAIVSQNRLTVDHLREQNPVWINKLHYIPPGVSLGTTPYPLRKKHQLANQHKLFLHPASIRPVKANLELLQLCDQLAAQHSDFNLAFCGPALDQDYFASFIAAVEKRPWAHYLGVIPSDAMPSAMKEADVILNHSTSEGMSNALLEAVAVGRPILARNIPGNASIPSNKGHFQLYESDEEFIDLALKYCTASPAKVQTSDQNYDQISSATESSHLFDLFSSVS